MKESRLIRFSVRSGQWEGASHVRPGALGHAVRVQVSNKVRVKRPKTPGKRSL